LAPSKEASARSLPPGQATAVVTFVLGWDRQALLWVNAHHHRVLDAILLAVSFVGEMGGLWIVVGLALLAIGRPRYRRTAAMLLLTMIVVDRMIAAPLGHWVYRERPYLVIEGIRQMGHRWAGSSFPSGHAHSVWVATIILSKQWRRLRTPLIVFSVLTCYARPYLGMHYPLDVIVGAALGIGGGFAALGVERLWRRVKEESR